MFGEMWVWVRSSTISVLCDGTSFRGEPKVGFGVGDKNNKKQKNKEVINWLSNLSFYNNFVVL
jgi:hypothetical protein